MPNPSSCPPHPTALLIGISGPSSSGKTTLARLLRDILAPHAFILHEDDFYKTDADIPLHPGTELQDWDCLDAIDVPLLEGVVRYVKENGRLPGDFVSKEDKNEVGESGVDGEVVGRWSERMRGVMEGAVDGSPQENGASIRTNNAEKEAGKRTWTTPIAIIDGFLLYPSSLAAVRSLFDIKLFLRASYATAKRRREARSGYVTLEGFWEDPPGYVDRVVWPNYVKDHGFLFEGGDVDGRLNEEVLKELGIEGVPEGLEGDMTGVLEWAMGIVEVEVKRKMEEEGR